MGKVVIRYWCALILGLALVTLSFPHAEAGQSARLFAVQLTANSVGTQIVIGLGQPAQFHATAQPGDRVAIDFEGVTLIPDGTAMNGVGLVRSYHAEPIAGGVRLVLDLARPAVITATRALPAEGGKPPRAVLRIDVNEVYFHCGKALMRSKLWSTERVERSVMPSISQVIHDQTSLGEPEGQDVVYERYKTQL